MQTKDWSDYVLAWWPLFLSLVAFAVFIYKYGWKNQAQSLTVEGISKEVSEQKALNNQQETKLLLIEKLSDQLQEQRRVNDMQEESIKLLNHMLITAKENNRESVSQVFLELARIDTELKNVKSVITEASQDIKKLFKEYRA